MKEKQANTEQVFLSPEKLDSFKEAFDNCEGTQFEFEGHPVLKSYAEYLIEHLDNIWPQIRQDK
tara:strand:- start:3186 stop:3377 length:192 start_codon:yes stop_codon:yes gene_type:complete